MKKLLLFGAIALGLNAFGQPLSLTYPNQDLCTDSTYNITWSGGSPSDLINIVVVDINAWAVDFYVAGSVQNTGSYTWTAGFGPMGSGLKCFYVENTQQSTWAYGPNFILDNCCSPVTIDENISSCVSYTWPANGMTYTNTGIYYDSLTSIYGCDSITALNLTINQYPLTTVTQIGNSLISDQSSANYQWLDCNNNFTTLPGETNQSFTSGTIIGSYCVSIDINGCIDTSDCYIIDVTDIDALEASSKTLLKIIDLTGRETKFKPKTPLIYIYSDGTRERVMKIEE